MRTHALCLRDIGPDERPFAIEGARGCTVVGLASAWGAWCGRDGETPAVVAAVDALRRAVDEGEVLGLPATTSTWSPVVARAFRAASEAVEELPAEPWLDPRDGTEDDTLAPCTSLACAVVTPRALVVGWCGGVRVGVLESGVLARATVPHNLSRQLRESGEYTEAQLEQVDQRFGDIIVRVVQRARYEVAVPEVEVWPPLGPQQRLLLAPRTLFEALAGVSEGADADVGEAWLRSLLTADDEIRDRVAVLVAPG